ncbi:hypothetical protein [Blastococcus saxobsidens]|uniref:Uncharacterized protein n=1 Tax=Blastococcus saxobsidens (strain DD2) TaxID=1146883 RepID=H6RMY6_BLASD|nr:hypothetical protein [Blastococcus saxobsidens]CCG01339.1 protein of unknown function [Blastococcus saxobsidens DD2]
MTNEDYTPPTIAEIGSLHELTLQAKDFTGVDGIVLQPDPNAPGVPLGPVSP